MRLTKLGLLLLEVIVGTADDRVCVLEFAVEVFSVLPVSDLDMHEQPLGHLVKLMANSFDEHAVMADPLIDVLEPAINRFKASVISLQSLFERFEVPIMPVQVLFNPAESFVEVLNKFLIHPTPAAMGTIRGSAVHVNGTQQSAKG
ncbi:MAG: hypothetical protein E6K68_11385 [Nitrospirae bacterium]|nr:MAG: hypothetical protein E6K68_11385 [Nitrospirota bacterium]